MALCVELRLVRDLGACEEGAHLLSVSAEWLTIVRAKADAAECYTAIASNIFTRIHRQPFG